MLFEVLTKKNLLGRLNVEYNLAKSTLCFCFGDCFQNEFYNHFAFHLVEVQIKLMQARPHLDWRRYEHFLTGYALHRYQKWEFLNANLDRTFFKIDFALKQLIEGPKMHPLCYYWAFLYTLHRDDESMSRIGVSRDFLLNKLSGFFVSDDSSSFIQLSNTRSAYLVEEAESKAFLFKVEVNCLEANSWETDEDTGNLKSDLNKGFAELREASDKYSEQYFFYKALLNP